MIINTANLTALRTGFSTAFKNGLGRAAPMADRIATTVPASTKEQRYGWINKIANVREWLGARVVQNISESDYSIREKPWELTLGVDRDDIETDNLGIYSPLFEQLGQTAASHSERLVWSQLKAGFTTNCYDGQFFFDTDHPVLDTDGVTVLSVANTDGGSGAPWFLLDVSQVLKPIILQVRRPISDIIAKDKPTDDNVFDRNEYVYGVDGRYNVGFGLWQFAWGSKQPLNAANYAIARAALLGMKGDGGDPLGVGASGKKLLLVVPPTYESAGRKLLASALGSGGETNEWADSAELLMVPWLA